MLKPRRFASLSILWLALAGCDITESDAGPAPGMRFRYSGLRTGEFSAKGAAGEPAAAYAVDATSWGELWIVAYKYTSPGVYDDVRLDIRNAKVGTYACSDMANCDITNGWVGFSQLDGGGEATTGGNVRATSARVTISSLSRDTVKGTFEMQMSGWVGVQGQLTVTRGEFNVPITRR